MTRIIFTYGLISGLVIIIASLIVIVTHADGNVFTGYLIMLVGLSSILLGVKQHRDQALGGVIKFWPALMVGLGIAAAASLAYVVVWEIYLAATHYSFMDKYVSAMLAAKRAAGVSGAAYAKAVAAGNAMRAQYANPLYRLPETFLEIFPVGFLIAIVSAALLRNPRILPSRSRSVVAA
jgi:hypothetical protein